MSEIVTLSVALGLRSPFMFQGLANAMLGIDAAYLRDECGRPIIPADQIKGVLRAACEVLKERVPDIAPETLLSRLFGGESPKHTDNDFESYDRPDRGHLIANDLTAQLSKEESRQLAGKTTRIEIDDETGAVKSGALQVVELVAPFGKEVVFKGEFVLLAGDGIDPKKAEILLSRALALVPAIGAFKSAGFGEVVESKLVIAKRLSAALPRGRAMPEDRVAYRVTFDRPILVDAERVTDNLFQGAAVVPGAVLAGMMKLVGADSEHWEKALAALRISHAFPENDNGELSCLPLPASLYGWMDGKKENGEENVRFADALLHGDLSPQAPVVGFMTMTDGRPSAPVYPADWKDKYFTEFSKQQCRFPMPAPLAPQPRTHVKIDADRLIAIDAALFTTVAQGVLLQDRKTPRNWRVVVDFCNVAEGRQGELRQLIECGLVPIGRTAAYARFEPITSADPPNGCRRARSFASCRGSRCPSCRGPSRSLCDDTIDASIVNRSAIEPLISDNDRGSI